MEDLRLWSRETIKDFIDLYKSHPCLWKVKSDEYKNKHTKSKAYKELVQFCKNKGFPEATKDFVMRKLQSLRGSFRKEVRKSRLYRRAGKAYQSSLWYFNDLLFTKDQDTETADDGDDGSQSDEVTCQSTEDVYDEVDDEKFLVETKPSKVFNVSDCSDSPQSPPPPKRRKQPTEDYHQPEFFDVNSTRLGRNSPNLRELSEFELTGINITKKLARMDPTQAIYAESIINNVIRKGLLKKLSEETDLCDNMCGRRIVTLSNVPSQSSAQAVSMAGIRVWPNTSI